MEFLLIVLLLLGALAAIQPALSLDAPVKPAIGDFIELPMLASATIYEGGMVGLSSGYARAYTQGDVFVGHADEQRTEATGSNGGANIRVRVGIYTLEVSVTGASAVTDAGSPVYASDDATLTLTPCASNRQVGVVRRWLTSTTCDVTFMTHDCVMIRTNDTVAASGFIIGIGTAASPKTTATADGKFIELRCETTATSGDNRLAYLRYALEGGGGGECLRASTVVNSNVGTAHGAHFGIEFKATAGGSECSGLGVGVRGTLMIPNVASWAPAGTYAAGMFEIYSEGSASDPAGMTELSCLRLCNSGDATGMADVDTDACLLSLAGWTSAADLSKCITTAPLAELASGNVIGIRIKVDGATYWMPAVPSASWN